MNEGELVAARRKVGSAAKTIIGELQALVSRATDVVNAPDVLRTRASEAVKEAISAQTMGELRATPVAKLRDVVPKGVRFGNLEQAGYRTVADVHAASPAQLRAVPGIGETSAREICAAAILVARQFRQQAVIRFDLDSKSAQDTRLLGRLVGLRVAERAAAPLRDRADRLGAGSGASAR